MFYYIMAVLLVNSNFIVTGYVMPVILFVSTWFMVRRQTESWTNETTVLVMAVFIQVLAFLVIGYYRMHKHFVSLFIA